MNANVTTIPADFPVQPLADGAPAKDRATCGHCDLSWDDAIPTSWTPAPSARCPFEYFHVYPEDIPTDDVSANVKRMRAIVSQWEDIRGRGVDESNWRRLGPITTAMLDELRDLIRAEEDGEDA